MEQFQECYLFLTMEEFVIVLIKIWNKLRGRRLLYRLLWSLQNLYGAETAISSGTSQTITYDNLTTKAFRSDLLFTNPATSDIAGNTINIRCANIVHVLLFSQSCVPTEYTVNGTSLVLNPVISVNSKFYTIQYVITATKGDCVIR